VHGLGRDHDSFSAGEYSRARRSIWIAGPQVLGVIPRFAVQKRFGITSREPAAFFVDPDRYDVVFAFIDGVHHGRGGKEGHFVFTATAAEQDSHAQFFHDDSVSMLEAFLVNPADGSAC
jgi:hypothetical protein